MWVRATLCWETWKAVIQKFLKWSWNAWIPPSLLGTCKNIKSLWACFIHPDALKADSKPLLRCRAIFPVITSYFPLPSLGWPKSIGDRVLSFGTLQNRKDFLHRSTHLMVKLWCIVRQKFYPSGGFYMGGNSNNWASSEKNDFAFCVWASWKISCNTLCHCKKIQPSFKAFTSNLKIFVVVLDVCAWLYIEAVSAIAIKILSTLLV